MLVLDPIQHRMARGSFIHSYTGGSWISAIPTYGFLRHCRHNGDQQKTCVIKKALFPMKLPKIHGKNMEKPCLEIPTWTNPTICSLQFYQNVQNFPAKLFDAQVMVESMSSSRGIKKPMRVFLG